MRKGLQFFGVLFFLKGFLFFSIASFGQKITPTAIDQPKSLVSRRPILIQRSVLIR